MSQLLFDNQLLNLMIQIKKPYYLRISSEWVDDVHGFSLSIYQEPPKGGWSTKSGFTNIQISEGNSWKFQDRLIETRLVLFDLDLNNILKSFLRHFKDTHLESEINLR